MPRVEALESWGLYSLRYVTVNDAAMMPVATRTPIARITQSSRLLRTAAHRRQQPGPDATSTVT